MTRKHWICLVVVGIIYAAVGIGFGEIAKRVPTDQSRVWRLGAWVASVVVYAVHFGYEQFRVNQRSIAVALHVATAVGLGGFFLAVAAGVHALFVEVHAPFWLFGIALVAWPIFTGAPAFVVAFVASFVLNRIRSPLVPHANS
jgi:hypothetical protein